MKFFNINNKQIFTIIILFHIININSQIICLPKDGDRFETINVGVNFRENADINSKVLYKIINPKETFLYCIEDGYTNDFVKLEIFFSRDYLEKNGLKKNFIKLYEHFKDSLHYDLTMIDFIESLKSTEKASEYYNTIIDQNDNSTIQYWSDFEDEKNIYDVSTINSFRKNYLTLVLNPNSKNIIENYGKVGFINKSQLKYGLNPTIYFYTGSSSEYSLQELNEYMEIKDANYCEFNERELFAKFSNYILSLCKEEKFFLAIKEINNYSSYFNLSKYQFSIDFLRMFCSDGDNNHSGAIIIAKKIIDSYKQNKLPKEILYGINTVVNGSVNISLVYECLIRNLVNTKANTTAYIYSTECLKNKKIQYDGYLYNHGIISLNLGKKVEACKFFNLEYLNGNDEVKHLIDEHCNQ